MFLAVPYFTATIAYHHSSKCENHPEWDFEPRVFIHIEEYVFHDTLGLEEKPMIAIEYWYYYAYDEDPVWG